MDIEKILRQEELKNAAKDYLSKGLSIIPTGKDKKPCILWKEFCDRLATWEEVEGWFEKFPDMQLGMVCGKISRITVLDVEAEGGEKEWMKLPQNCPIVKSGSGGRHYWYLYDKSIKTGARLEGDVGFCDCRNDGGYVILPPSISEKGSYEWIQKVPPCRFPRELFKKKEENVGYAATQIQIKSKNFAMGLMEDLYLGAAAGNRNESMVKYVGYILTQIHPEDWEEKAWPLTISANNKNTPPLSTHELRRSYDSIRQAEKAKNPDRFSSGTPEKWQTGEENDEVKLMSEVAEAQTIDLSHPFPIGVDIFDKEIRGGFFPGDLIIIAAGSGHGKTSFSQYLSYNFIKRNKQKVLFFSYEVLSFFVWDKFKNMGLTKEDLIYMPFKHSTGNLEWVEKKIKEAKDKFGTNFIVIDHLGFLELSKKEGKQTNFYETERAIVRQVKKMAIKHEIIIVMLVHVRKKPSGDKRPNADLEIEDIAGSAGIYQESDIVFLLQREEELRKNSTSVYTNYTRISMGKNRRGSKNPRGWFTLLNDVFVYDPFKDVPMTDRPSSEIYSEEDLNNQLKQDFKNQEEEAKKLSWMDD
jgi:Bifunctional DNA primase/polymerase, N-terminal/DnaB-like helicase C terminal domain